MDATFLARVKRDYPKLRFREGKRFSYHFPGVITVGPAEDGDELLLLHEVGHALHEHKEFTTEVERIKCEREAWEAARGLCARYGVTVDEELIEAQMESYREWLHQKSRCPKCGLTRFQAPDGAFHCPLCENYG